MSSSMEKTIQQLKDSLPKVMDQVKIYVDIADELDKVMSKVVGVKVKVKKPVDIGKLSEGLAKYEGHLSDCEKALEDITELISRMDKILVVEKKTKEIIVVRKSYQMQQNILIDAIQRIKEQFSKLAEGNMPKEASLIVEVLVKKLQHYLSDKVDLIVENDIRRSKKETAFVKFIKIDYKRPAFICVSMNYDIESSKFGPVQTSFFVDIRPKPPYEVGNKTWLSKGYEFDGNRVFALMLFYDMHEIISDFPSNFMKFFKAPPKRIKELEEEEFIYKMGGNVGKSPIATFLIRPEFVEITKEGIPNGHISEPKANSILAKIRNVFPPRKGLEMSPKWDKVTVKSAKGEKEDIYRLTVKFFPPGLSKLIGK